MKRKIKIKLIVIMVLMITIITIMTVFAAAVECRGIITIISNDRMASIIIPDCSQVKFGEDLVDAKKIISLKASGIDKLLPENLMLIRAYKFLPSEITLEPEAEVKIKYNVDEVKSNAFLIMYDEELEKWITLESIDDKENLEVIAKTGHFSTFALVTAHLPSKLTPAAIRNAVINFIEENWLKIVIIIGVILFSLLIAYLSIRKK